MTIALVALFVALGGTGYAASRIAISPRSHATTARRHSGRLARKGAHGARGHVGPLGPRGLQGQTGPEGPQGPQGQTGQTGAQGETGSRGQTGVTGEMGPTGPQGIQGQAGVQGPQGPQGVPGDARAYAFVEPQTPCGGCMPTTPLRPGSLNVSLGSPLLGSGAPAGTWCFVLAGGIEPSTATIVASVEGPAPSSSLDIAQWVAGAPDCSPEQVEVQTFRYKDEGSGLISEHSGKISFSFVVP